MIGATAALWVALAAAALIIGISKTAMPAASSLAVAIFATQLPPREATGAILVLLIAGDLVAITVFRHHADWREVRRLIPSVLVGIAIGAAVLAIADDAVLRRLIGGVLLALLVGSVILRIRRRAEIPTDDVDGRPRSRSDSFRALGFGVLGGFTTMAANAGGAVMSAYFLASRLSVTTFLGTAAWFFLVVNLIKLPISIGMGLLGTAEFVQMLPLIPLVVVGTALGRLVMRGVRQTAFEISVMVLTLASTIVLLV